MNSLFSFLKRSSFALVITRRALRRPTPLVPRGVMPPTIPAIPPEAAHRSERYSAVLTKTVVQPTINFQVYQYPARYKHYDRTP